MRKIKIMEHASLDGVIQPGGPDENSEWSNGGWMVKYRTPEGMAAVLAAQGERYDLLLGRRTYDLWSAFWPKMTGNPFAERINGATKYVATHRPESLSWGPLASLGADAIEGVRRLKSSDGADLLVSGSASLASQLFEHGLVDEVVVAVYPILMGRGKRYFGETSSPRELAFVKSMTTPTGVQLSTYRYVGELKKG